VVARRQAHRGDVHGVCGGEHANGGAKAADEQRLLRCFNAAVCSGVIRTTPAFTLIFFISSFLLSIITYIKAIN